MQSPNQWRPLAVAELQSHLGGFTEWTLCGGHAIDLLVGRQTRPHGDIDIGVFRSQLVECLEAIGVERIFLCGPDGHVAWNGAEVAAAVHDIWISDAKVENWLLQIMVFDDEGEEVFYRRDRRVRWSKRSHFIVVGSLRVLNPFITFLFKANKPAMAEKEVMDVVALISQDFANALRPR